MPHISECQSALIATIIFCEYVFELLGLEATFRVEGHAVAPVFVFIDVVEIDTEERVGKPAVYSGIAKIDVDDEGYQSGEKWVPACDMSVAYSAAGGQEYSPQFLQPL